jgi:hypothetical protein
MIRINLLEEQRGRGVSKGDIPIAGPRAPGGEAPPVILYLLQAVIPILALLVIGAVWFMWKGDIRRLDHRIEEARAEVKRLEGVIKLNEELQKKRQLLKRKIEVIENLKRNQNLPVTMMDQISANLVDLVWFDNLKVAGRRIMIQGKAQTHYAVASLIRNLERSPYFEAIVPDSIRETGGLQVWSLSFDFVIPSREQPAAQVSELR